MFGCLSKLVESEEKEFSTTVVDHGRCITSDIWDLFFFIFLQSDVGAERGML